MFLLAGDINLCLKYIQGRFIYNVSDPFTEHKERKWKLKEAWNSRHIYQNRLDKACFQHDMVYGDFKD